MTPEQRRTIAQVKTSSEHLLDLIGDLLELTMLKRGGLEVVPTAFDVRDPLHDAVANTRGRAEQVALRVAEPAAGTIMTSDRRKITKMLAALLSNAYKFTPSGEVRVAVEVADGRAMYRVQDTGIGRQVDGSITRRFGGSGLGLSLARRLARLLGGEIHVESMQGEGSTFRVELPLTWRDGEREPAAPPPSTVALR